MVRAHVEGTKMLMGVCEKEVENGGFKGLSTLQNILECDCL